MKNFKMKKQQGGFTLIELLITVAIVAILALLATTAYADYTARVQVSEGLSMAQGPKLAADIAYQEGQGTPAFTSIDAGFDSTVLSGKFVQTVLLSGGSIMIVFRDDAPAAIAGHNIGLTPYETGPGGVLQWHCGNSPIPNDGAALPTNLSLAGTAAGAPVSPQASSMPDEFMPSNCRP